MLTLQDASTELRSCVFCGGKPELYVLEHEGVPEMEPIYFVKCYDCSARGPHRESPFAAEAWWNGDYFELAIQERDEWSS